LRADFLHVVTDDEVVARPDFLRLAAEVVDAGGSSVVLHLRVPHGSGRTVFRLAEALRSRTRDAGSSLLINDRLDVALAVDADGVQLGRRGLSATDARAMLGPERRIGVSAHGPAAVPEADFFLVGNVYPTASHPGRAGIGVAGLAHFRDVPVVAIGGVTPERVAELRAAGVRGVAAIRGIWDAPSPAAAVRGFLKEWRG
jgi:thiamine-phosphate pyrophosphorylase